MAFYESIAPWYDHIFPAAPAQVSFTASICGSLKDKKVLDVGCGTGNLSLLLAEAGAEVCGIDLDAEMVRLGRKKAVSAGRRIDFRVGNMLGLDQLKPLFQPDAVLCYGNTLVHLPEDHLMASFFQQAAQLMPKGGFLLLQIIHYNHILDHQVDELPTIDNEQIRFERRYRNLDNGLLAFDTTLYVKGENRKINNSVALNPIRKEKLQELLKKNGFESIRLFGDFKAGPLQDHSIPLILTAQKS